MKNNTIKRIFAIVYKIMFILIFVFAVEKGRGGSVLLRMFLPNNSIIRNNLDVILIMMPLTLLGLCITVRTFVNRSSAIKMLLNLLALFVFWRIFFWIGFSEEFISEVASELYGLYLTSIPLIYFICRSVIRNEPETPKEVDSSTYSGGSYGYTGGSYSSARTEEANFDANRYVKNHCSGYIYGLSTDTDKQRIDSDPDLTDEQKEDAKRELDSLAALYY